MVKETLLKVLTGAGVGSRRQLADAIKQGRVVVNGQVVEDFRYPVDRDKDRIFINGRLIDIKLREQVYLVLNKPPGVLSTTSDERGRRTVMDMLPGKYRDLRLYPVGRLDVDSTGLLLLTNDGKLTYHLTHPRFEHEKEYLVAIEGSLKTEEKKELESGIRIEGKMTGKAVVNQFKYSPPYNYSIIIHEGKKRQVRQMFAALGYRVLALKRVRMGNLRLGKLKEGQVRELTNKEVLSLLEEVKYGKRA